MVPPMPTTPDELFARLTELGIAFTTHEHPPLYTVQDSKALRGRLPGGHTKNLFLRDKKGRQWLLVAEEDRQIDIKSLKPALGAQGSLSFGSAERLMDALGVEPGAVTAFAAVNDIEGAVTVFVDKDLLAENPVNCHPLVNTMTTALSPDDLLKFLRATGHEPVLIDLSADPPAAVS